MKEGGKEYRLPEPEPRGPVRACALAFLRPYVELYRELQDGVRHGRLFGPDAGRKI